MAEAPPDVPSPLQPLCTDTNRPPGTSKSALYMQHLKKFYPEKYRELRAKDRERRAKKKAEKKALKENLPQTRAEKEKEAVQREKTK